MTMKLERELNGAYSEALRLHAQRLEDEAETERSDGRREDMIAEAERTYTEAHEYWVRSAGVTESELIRAAMTAYAGVDDEDLEDCEDVTEPEYELGELGGTALSRTVSQRRVG
jgi:hypothetical protein